MTPYKIENKLKKSVAKTAREILNRRGFDCELRILQNYFRKVQRGLQYGGAGLYAAESVAEMAVTNGNCYYL